MAEEKQKDSYKIFLTALGGVLVLILGITLVLVWWQDVVSLFKGFIGMALALGGLLFLYMLNK